jgi:hypothetical protein
MPRSYPDWSNVRKEVSFILREDLAELAARLGSIDVFDRRGYVLWWDDFKHGLGAWRTATDGTGASVALSTVYPKWPPFALKLTGGSDGSRIAEAYKYFKLPVAGKIGVEISIDFLTDFDEFYLELRMDDLTTIHRAKIKIDGSLGTLHYLDSDNDYQELGDVLGLVDAYGGYHNLKLVVDFSVDEYVRVILDRTAYDLTDVASYTAGDPSSPFMRLHTQLVSRDGENDECQIDGVIVTQDEE